MIFILVLNYHLQLLGAFLPHNYTPQFKILLLYQKGKRQNVEKNTLINYL